MDFEAAYQDWLSAQIKKSRGMRRDRLTNHGHGERMFLKAVWWPAFHNFANLEGEYPVSDFKDGQRFIDFVYLQPHFRIALEIDGEGPHWKDITTWNFVDHGIRQDHLENDGWHVLRFPYPAMLDMPRNLQQIVQQAIGRLSGDASAEWRKLPLYHREIARLAMRFGEPITVMQISRELAMSRYTATRHAKKLCAENWLQAIHGQVKILGYQLHPSRQNIQI